MDKAIGQRLVARAKELKLTNAEVARRLGLAESRYAHYVSGSREPDFKTFAQICRVLGTSPNHLLGLADGLFPDSAASIMQDRAVLALGAMDADTVALAVDLLELLARRSQRTEVKGD